MPAKRTKKVKALPQPDYEAGLKYCGFARIAASAHSPGTALEPTVDTVLGGFGTGSLPRIDALRCGLLVDDSCWRCRAHHSHAAMR